MKKKNNLVARISKIRKRIRTKVQKKVLSEYEVKKKLGKYPWEGVWLSPQDISKVQAKMKKRDRVVFAELLCLILISLLSSYILFGFIFGMLPK